ncbi:hypothetical protein [Rubellimicrobium arenae]|uniref:hypothetical protein n=1 Tax=Rubellimicrobium arenae TaxID=2817372 RepID=UPI001B314484|nr:hypothetical protein [Rubellimicrobium arenae]
MRATYHAMQVAAPGRFEIVERPVPRPAPGEILIAVEACGICDADASNIEKADPAARWVPDHAVVGGERGRVGSITGSPYESERTVDFSVLTGVRPLIDVLPLERAQTAYDRMRSGDATFRMVLTMGDSTDAHQ